MAVRKVKMHRLQELVRLHRMGTRCREVARLLRMSPNTERAYREVLGAAGFLEGPADDVPSLEVLRATVEAGKPVKASPQHVSSVARWESLIIDHARRNVGPKAIFDLLRLQDPDFDGSLSAVKRVVGRYQRNRAPRADEVAIVVDTVAGEVAQVDFGYVGRVYDPPSGVMRRAWVFVMVLGYSRHMYARLVFDQKTSTWLRLHVEAFTWFGGVPKTLVPDNLKAAVIRGAFGAGDTVELNRSYRELARHFGFKVDPTPPRSPEKKGKVESGVKYVKRNFFRPREGMDVHDLDRELPRWLTKIAGARVHGTTGLAPLDVFEQEERSALLPLPSTRFEPVVWKQAKVHTDCHIVFERRQYSVPWRLVGKQVWVRATPSTVMVFCDDTRVATHPRPDGTRRLTVEEHLPDGRSELRHRSQTYWLKRADALGPEVGQYVREVFACDDVLSQLRAVQAIVMHLANFPAERANRACARASFFGAYSYQALKNILRKALDYEPLPAPVAPGLGELAEPRFARTARELVQLPLEIHHEPN